jgi:hypothetical protein
MTGCAAAIPLSFLVAMAYASPMAAPQVRITPDEADCTDSLKVGRRLGDLCMVSSAVLSRVALIVLCAVVFTACAGAQTPLKTIDNPGGGKITYGRVEGQSTEAGAMGAILQTLHRQYNDKPQVDRVFQVRGTNSAAVFFTLVKRTQGNARVAGLLIASQTGPDQVEAALLSDDAARFGTTVNPMLKALFGIWHPGAQVSGKVAPSTSGQALTNFVLPDRSASVSLPPGWKVEPSSGGGTIFADGPNGESIALDFPLLAWNSSDARVRRTMQFAQGGGRNTAYARALYYPYGTDLGKTFVDLLEMRRRLNNLPAAAMQVENESPAPAAAGSRCARLQGRVDPHDGKGVREFNTVFCSGALSPMGQYSNILFHTAIPIGIAVQERATMGAILDSFKVDMSTVNRQAAALAAPAIEHIHAIGRAAAAQAQQAHEMNDRHNQSVEARWNSQDKGSQAFSNYLLDQSVIADNDSGGHATVWNQTADALVKNNPSRYNYVETPNFWKGVDY